MLHLSHITYWNNGKLILNDIRLRIQDGTCYGLAGGERLGREAFLRTIMGILRPDMGDVFLDCDPVYENEILKQQIFLMAENMYFRPRATLEESARFYAGYHPTWEPEIFARMVEMFGLELKKRRNNCTKKELALMRLVIAFSICPKVLLLENPFLDIDEQSQKTVAQMIRSYVVDRSAIVVVAAQKLEYDICDHYGYLDDGNLHDDMTAAEYECAEGAKEKEGVAYDAENFFR